ncbi:MAG: sigma-70 family RNA polymerase sigma factor [Planctomycetota bacterium]
MFSQLPETRPSILIRVCESSDEEAWTTFVAVYRPAIYRIARGMRLQDADANDVSQSVLSKLAQRSWKFEPSSEGVKFRSWLATVTRNAVVDHLRAQPSLGDLQPDSQSIEDHHPVGEAFELEYRRQVFHWAAKIIQDEFSVGTWRAFWLTSVEHRSVEEVARELDRSIGSIYTSRSRVMRRLRAQVLRFDDKLGGEL